MITVTRQQKGNRRFYTVEGDPSVEGIQLPSVTTLTNILDKPGLVVWAERLGIEACQQFVASNPPFETNASLADLSYSAYLKLWADNMGTYAKGVTTRTRDSAAEVGTGIHKVIEEMLRGEGPVNIPAPYVQAVNNFTQWYSSSGLIDVQFSELAVYSSEYRYGGTIDAIAHNYDPYHSRVVLLDWKTSNGLYPETALQLAGYAQAYSEMYNIDPSTIELLAVRFGKDRPDFEVKRVVDFGISFTGFLACRAIYEWKKSKPLV